VRSDLLKLLQQAAIAAIDERGESDILEARRTWRALMDGEWILVTIFSRSGRQFMIAKRCTAAPEPLLTDRERWVLALRARAQGIKGIALRLTMSQATVRRVLMGGMRKLGLTSSSDLARFETL
jgi:DNA-binding NarL/FixJ family response regulator